jgi:hypothetical protein
MRRELTVMGAVAAVVGIALAALLTTVFGARSSGPPATLRPAAPAPAQTAASSDQKLREAAVIRARARARRRAAQRRRVRRERSRPAPAAQPVVADTTPAPSTQQTRYGGQTVQQQTQAPRVPVQPAPKVTPLRRPAPKPSGGTFDDSG